MISTINEIGAGSEECENMGRGICPFVEWNRLTVTINDSIVLKLVSEENKNIILIFVF